MKKEGFAVLLLVLLFVNVGFVSGFDEYDILTRAGDANGDKKVDISDPVRIFGYLFLGDPKPSCLRAADVNEDSVIDISDGVYLLRKLFVDGSLKLPSDVMPGACDIVGDVSGRTIQRFNGEIVRIGGHVKAIEAGAIVNGNVEIVGAGNNNVEGQANYEIIDDTINCKTDEWPVGLVVNPIEGCTVHITQRIFPEEGFFRYFAFDCADDTLPDVIEYSTDVKCASAKDDLTVIPSDNLIATPFPFPESDYTGIPEHDIITGEGDDDVTGSPKDDAILTYLGNDVAFGNNGADYISLGAGHNFAFGGPGEDYLNEHTSNDVSNRNVFIGGSGNDYIEGTSDVSEVIAIGGTGEDTISMSEKNGPLYAFGGPDGDSIIGSSKGDLIVGDSEFPDVTKDEIRAYIGDVYSLFLSKIRSSNLFQQLLNGQIPVEPSEGKKDLVRGGCGGDIILSEGGDDDVDGDRSSEPCNDGDDLLIAGSGDDKVEGGEGSDVVSGGSGNDVLRGDSIAATASFSDYVCGGEGNDDIRADNPNGVGAEDWIASGPRPANTKEKVFGLAGTDVFFVNGQGIFMGHSSVDSNDYVGGTCGTGTIDTDEINNANDNGGEICRIASKGWGPGGPANLLENGVFPVIDGVAFQTIIFPNCGPRDEDWVEEDIGDDIIPWDDPIPAGEECVCCSLISGGTTLFDWFIPRDTPSLCPDAWTWRDRVDCSGIGAPDCYDE